MGHGQVHTSGVTFFVGISGILLTLPQVGLQILLLLVFLLVRTIDSRWDRHDGAVTASQIRPLIDKIQARYNGVVAAQLGEMGES